MTSREYSPVAFFFFFLAKHHIQGPRKQRIRSGGKEREGGRKRDKDKMATEARKKKDTKNVRD